MKYFTENKNQYDLKKEYITESGQLNMGKIIIPELLAEILQTGAKVNDHIMTVLLYELSRITYNIANDVADLINKKKLIMPKR